MSTTFSAAKRSKIKTVAERVLTELRPFFNEDGGDITLDDVTEDGVVRVTLHGACKSCAMSKMTIKGGIEEAIKKAVPEVVGVEAVDARKPVKQD